MKGNIKCKIYGPHQGVLWVKTKTDEIYKNRPLYSWASIYGEQGAFTKIVNLTAQRSGILVLGWGSICHIVNL